MDATPSFALPTDAASGLPEGSPAPLTMRGRTFRWGSRTYLMGIVNVTPDSFSGDGLLGTDEGAARAVEGAVEQGRRMVEEGANILDVGGESSRPGHQPVAMA